jgi:hypothetical protein
MFVLWPMFDEGIEYEEPRVVDTGNLMAYFSYPEADHQEGVPVDLAGPDYIRVPNKAEEEFEYGKSTYRFLNRWFRIVD